MKLSHDLKQIIEKKARTDAGFAVAAAIADLADAQRDIAARLTNIDRLDLIVDHHAKAVSEIASAIGDISIRAEIGG